MSKGLLDALVGSGLQVSEQVLKSALQKAAAAEASHVLASLRCRVVSVAARCFVRAWPPQIWLASGIFLHAQRVLHHSLRGCACHPFCQYAFLGWSLLPGSGGLCKAPVHYDGSCPQLLDLRLLAPQARVLRSRAYVACVCDRVRRRRRKCAATWLSRAWARALKTLRSIALLAGLWMALALAWHLLVILASALPRKASATLVRAWLRADFSWSILRWISGRHRRSQRMGVVL